MPRFCLSVAVLAAAGFLAPDQARAHAILMDSQPAARASMPAGPAAITLRFNSRVDHARSRMALRAAGTETALPVDPASATDSLAAFATLAPGDYVVRWQVLAVDGHITRGDVPFTVQAPAAQASAGHAPIGRGIAGQVVTERTR